MENVILIDFELHGNWGFRDALEKSTGKRWKVLGLQSNFDHGGYKDLIRYSKYFSFPLSIFFRKKKYETVLAWQQFYGLILAFYFRLFRVKNGPEIYIMTFIYKAKQSLLGRLYYLFVRYSIESKFVKNIFVYSIHEQEYYSDLFKIPKEVFKPVKLGVEDDANRMNFPLPDMGYYLSAGRSNRDYRFLIDAWKRQDRKLKIVSDALQIQEDDNIEVLDNCYGFDYKTMIAHSHAVIIPLQDEDVSSGQLVLLHAMMFGKPVIITKNNALESYIVDGENGFVIEKTLESIDSALSKIEDPLIYKKMCENARVHFEKNYSQEKLGEDVGRIICPR